VGEDELLEEVLIEEGLEEPETAAEIVGSNYLDRGPEETEKRKRAKFLAEEFETYLGARERFYNQYVLIPGGRYTVGSSGPGEDVLPERPVQVEPFYFGLFPITNALFEVFVEETGYTTRAEIRGYGSVYYGRVRKIRDPRTGSASFVFHLGPGYERVRGACWYRPSGPGSSLQNKRNHPVVQVSLEDAVAFASWTGKRLPTEIEWEAAMRTPQGHLFPWGNEWKDRACNVEPEHVGDTTPVDQYLEHANDLGIADGLGNVMEWTLDEFDPVSPGKSVTRSCVVKGASWLSDRDVRLDSRTPFAADGTSNILGFRCVADCGL